MSITATYDVIVIGGGPAGMMAAGKAGARGLRVLLIEKNTVLGKKLSITGGGRCNITNAEFEIRALLKHYGSGEQFLYSPFAQFGVKATFDFFTERKLPLIIEDRKRAFPQTMKATDVTKVMEEFVTKSGVTIITGTPVEGFETQEGKISGVITPQGIFTARAYVIASGGKSHGDTGSTGEGISWLRQVGHKTHESNPNLVPLVVSDSWVKKMSGTTLENVRITFTEGAHKLVKQGNVLCTHFGLSGPLILNSAHEVKGMLKYGVVTAHIDLFPKDDMHILRSKFQKLYESNPNKTLSNMLKAWFPKSLAEAIVSLLPETLQKEKAHKIDTETRRKLLERMKNMSLTVTGTMGYDWAVVSDGGVDVEEIDTKTMQSKLHKNLYFAGDVLHVNRPSGGYSLQLCWTTGSVVGENILSSKIDG